MPTYECSKCGEKAHSKNPRIRSVFPDDQIATMMTNIANVITEKQENGKRKVTLEFPYADMNEDMSDEDLELSVLKNIRALSDKEVNHWLCEHRWEIIPGTGTELDR